MKRWQILVGTGAVAILAIAFFASAWGKTELTLWRCNQIAERGKPG